MKHLLLTFLATGLLLGLLPTRAEAAPSTRGRLASRGGAVRQAGVALRRAPVLPPGDGAIAPPEAPAPERVPVSARLGRMRAPQTDIYRLPDPTSPWVGRLPQDQHVAIISQWQGWFAILVADGTEAYVPQTHVEVLPYLVRSIQLPPQGGAGPAPPATAVAGLAEPARRIIEEAFRYQGVSYVFGGNGLGGIDCSGLVKNAYAAAGINLPRKASSQAEVGQDVSFDRLAPGDRLYFSVSKRFDHTGIYLGDGYFIHSARSRGGVTVSHLSEATYSRSLAAARR